MPTRSNFSPTPTSLCGRLHLSLLATASIQYSSISSPKPTRSIPGECNLYQAEDPSHPGEFRPEATWPSSFLFLSLLFHTYGRLGLFSLKGKIPLLGYKRPNQGMPPASRDQVDARWRPGALPICGTPSRPGSHQAIPAPPAQPAAPASGLHDRRNGTRRTPRNGHGASHGDPAAPWAQYEADGPVRSPGTTAPRPPPRMGPPLRAARRPRQTEQQRQGRRQEQQQGRWQEQQQQ